MSKAKTSSVEVKPLSQRPFLEVETPRIGFDALKIYNVNPNYEYRWCKADDVVGNRVRSWVVLDKNHPEFEKMEYSLDYTPDKSFVKYKDVILCCVRKETAEKMRKLKRDKTAMRTRSISEGYEEKMNKLSGAKTSKELVNLMETTEKEE